MSTMLQDVRYGVRMLAKRPAFTAVAIVTLALGIGANTAIFSLIDAVMLRSLPVRDPSRLVLLRWTAHETPSNGDLETSTFGDCEHGDDKNPSGCSFPYPFFELIRSEREAFSGATAFAGPAQLVLSGTGPARMVRGELISGEYFSTLGVKTIVGRTIGANDDSLSASPAVVLSYDFWQSAFGGDRAAVGRTILLNRVPFTIIGVAEPSFTNLSPGKRQDMFLSLAMLPRLNISWGRHSRELSNWWLVILARLKPGITRAEAQAAASLAFRNEMLHGAKPFSKAADDPAIVLVPAQSGLTGERGSLSQPLYVLMFAVGFILLIACANVAGLLLSRAVARQKEMAVRLALGAGRRRIVRQLLTESVLLSLAGGVLGVLFAIWGVHAITALISSGLNGPFPFVIEPDWRILTFTMVVSVSTGILFGLAPAFRSTRLELGPALKENASTLPGGDSHAGQRYHLGKGLVVAQLALSMIVLIGAGLLVRTLQNLHRVDPGFDTRNILTFGLDPTLEKYKDAQIQNLYRELQERLAALPGVISVSYSSDTLLSGGLWTSGVHVEGQPEKTTQEVDMLGAGPDFFKTLRIPLVGGRTFAPEDFELADQSATGESAGEESAEAQTPSAARKTAAPGPPIPVLVNQAFVRKYFPNQNPLGKRLTQGGSSGATGDLTVGKPKSKNWEIIGVVGDTQYENLRREIHPAVFVPVTGGGAYFELRTASSPSALIPAVRDAVKRADSGLPLFDVRTQTEKIEDLLTQERVIASLSSLFGVLALLLACVGLYGLLSYEVTRRTREIAIRMALGAGRRDVTRLIIFRGIKLALMGVGIGVAGGLALTRVLASFLYGVKPTDLPTYLAVSLLLGAVALLASYIPARRATNVDPMVALRYE
jgi:predicted permease